MPAIGQISGQLRGQVLGAVSSGTSSIFTPASIAGLKYWVDATDPATVTQVSGATSQWNDKSTGGRNMIQGFGSQQPTYVSNADPTKRYMHFDGIDDLMAGTNGGLFSSVVPLTFCSRLRINNPQPGSFSGRLFSDRGLSGFLVGAGTSNVILFQWVGTGTNLLLRTNNAAYDNTNFHNIIVTHDGTGTATGSHIYIDGIEATYQTIQNGTNLAADGSSVGISTEGNGQGLTTMCIAADFKAEFIYNSVITSTQRSQVNTYLSSLGAA